MHIQIPHSCLVEGRKKFTSRGARFPLSLFREATQSLHTKSTQESRDFIISIEYIHVCSSILNLPAYSILRVTQIAYLEYRYYYCIWVVYNGGVGTSECVGSLPLCVIILEIG